MAPFDIEKKVKPLTGNAFFLAEKKMPPSAAAGRPRPAEPAG